MDWSWELRTLTTEDLIAEEAHSRLNLAEAQTSEGGSDYPDQLKQRLEYIHSELARRREASQKARIHLPKSSTLTTAIIGSILDRFDLTALIEETDTVYRAESPVPFFSCPAHPDARPSAFIYKRDKPHERYWCYSCNSGGDAIDWMIARHHLEFGPAVRELARRAGIAIPERRQLQSSISRRDLPAIWER